MALATFAGHEQGPISYDRGTGESQVKNPRNSRMVLWNDRSVVALCAVALIVTLGIVLFQMDMRSGLFDSSLVRIFYSLFLFQDYPASIIFVAVLLLGLVKPVQRIGAKAAQAAAFQSTAIVLLALVGFAIGTVFVYHSHPLAMDEYVPYFQSQIFVAGRLLGQFPPALVDWLIFPSFQGYFIHVSKLTGEFASAYWPGFAMLLTPFMAAGVPWLCNPLLGAAALMVIHRLALSLTQDKLAAGTAVLLTLASPAFVVNAISYYSMTAHLLCNAAFVLLVMQPASGRCALAGLIGGLALTLHNPVPHMLFAAPWLLWLAWRSDRWKTLPPLMAGYLPFVVVVGFGWHALVSGLAQDAAGTSGVSKGSLEAAIKTLGGVLAWPTLELLQVRLVALMKLWIWAVPAMVVLAAVGLWRRRADVHICLLLASAVLTLLGYLFVPADQGHGWGFRYFHSAWFVLPVLAAAAIAVPRNAGVVDASAAPDPLAGFSQGTAVASLLLLVPFLSWQVHSFISAHLEQLPKADSGRPRVVIISPVMQYYAQDLAQNDPFLRQPVIRMVSRGRSADARMIAGHFPDLVQLSKSYKGTVWGYPSEGGGRRDSAPLDVGAQDKRE